MLTEGLSARKTLEDHFPEWVPAYKAALLEIDSTKLQERIRLAHEAIAKRMQVLARDHGGSVEEQQAITDALNGLAMLERESRQPLG
jgi:hypothetical protein